MLPLMGWKSISVLRWYQYFFSSVQSLSRVRLFATPWITALPGLPPCPSPTPWLYSNSCPSSQWCHPAIPSSVIPFSSCFQSLPASESFPMSQLFTWGGQNTGVSALASFLPKNTQDWSPSEWTGWISLQFKGLSSLLQHHSSKTSICRCSAFFMLHLSHPIMTAGKTIASTRQNFVGKIMAMIFNMLSRFVIAFCPRSKHLLISWLQSPCTEILEPKKIKSVPVSIVSPSICHEMMGLDAMIFVLWRFNVKPAFTLSSFTFIKRLFRFSLLSAIKVVSSAYVRLLIFSQQSWSQLVLHPTWHFTWCTLHIS